METATTTFALGEMSEGLTQFNASTMEITDFKVFKTGTFKDSLGRQRRWTSGDLEKMVQNYTALTSRNIFSKVPVRVDHTTSAKDLVGWIQGLRHDGKFLYANVKFTEPDAAAKYQRGTYGPRSSEIGTYETNGDSPETFAPVYKGLAFVDIGAVEGLYSQQQDDSTFFQILTERQDSVTTGAASGQQGNQNLNQGGEGGAGSADHSQGAGAAGAAQPVQGEAGQGQAPQAAPPVSGATDAQHQGQAVTGNYTFRVAGQPTTDFGRVQQHIEALETFQVETTKANRSAFVNGLVGANKIAVTQKDAMIELATGMNDTQFAQFQASYDGAPALNVFGNHGAGAAGNGQAPDATHQAQSQTSEFSIVKDRVDMLRRSGMKQDVLEKTDSFKKLKSLEASGQTA